MKKLSILLLFLIIVAACKKQQEPVVFTTYDESEEIAKQQERSMDRMKLKLIQSKLLDKNQVFKTANDALAFFSEEDYNRIKPLVLEKDIPAIQQSVIDGNLTYEELTLFYLYRIRKFESNNNLALHTIIALNPNVVQEAREKDANKPNDVKYTLYGMPVLLKDNINTEGMPTTAGAAILQDNINTNDAFIVQQLKANGALILGKANLSEWAYFFCSGCPVGYSAVGGQTLNPYGRKVFESGGSSSGSGVTVAANYAVAAVGTETSGSILSPSSQNSVVGLKPTIGLLSRTGIVPISSTLDTPGPMTKNVVDNAIFLQAMTGKDTDDASTNNTPNAPNYLDGVETASFKGKRFGVITALLQDSIYAATVKKIENAGATMVEYNPPRLGLPGFLTLLNIDMKHDLPKYLSNYADENITVNTVANVVNFNLKDTLVRAPYGQQLFEGIVADTTSLQTLAAIKDTLHANGVAFFKEPLQDLKVDAVLSINNYHAGFAAVAKYPCLTVPMGYKASGEPISLTFIANPFEEHKLLQLGHAFEQLTKVRKLPEDYQ